MKTDPAPSVGGNSAHARPPMVATVSRTMFEAETGAIHVRAPLGVEESLEELTALAGRDAEAVVADLQDQLVAVMARGDLLITAMARNSRWPQARSSPRVQSSSTVSTVWTRKLKSTPPRISYSLRISLALNP